MPPPLVVISDKNLSYVLYLLWRWRETILGKKIPHQQCHHSTTHFFQTRQAGFKKFAVCTLITTSPLKKGHHRLSVLGLNADNKKGQQDEREFIHFLGGKRRHEYLSIPKKCKKDRLDNHTENRDISGILGKFESFFRKIPDSHPLSSFLIRTRILSSKARINVFRI